MTGSGTQQSPYVPTNWTELKQAAETTNAYIKLPDNSVWDLARETISGISMACTEIDFNGATINHLRFTSGGAIFYLGVTDHDIPIKNLTIKNAYIKDSTIFWAVSSTWVYYNHIYLENVIVEGALYNARLWYCDNQSVKTKNCAFSFVAQDSQLGTSNNEIKCTAIDFTGNVTAYIGALNLILSALYGNMYLGQRLRSSGLRVMGESCVVDAEFDNFGSIAWDGGNGAALINGSKLGGATADTHFIVATASQMLDAEWLNEHGFPVTE